MTNKGLHCQNMPMLQRIFSALKMDILDIFAKNIHCGYTLEPPHRGGSNEYPQCMFWIKNNKNKEYPA